MNEHLYPLSSTKIAALASQRIDIQAGDAVLVSPTGQGVWVRLGDSAVVATPGTDNESYVAAEDHVTFHRSGGYKVSGTATVREQSHIAIIEEAPTASGAVTVLG